MSKRKIKSMVMQFQTKSHEKKNFIPLTSFFPLYAAYICLLYMIVNAYVCKINKLNK